MTVEKSVDLMGTGSTIEEAVSGAVHRATLTLQGVTSFEVRGVEGEVGDGGELTYKARVRVWFVIKERLHE